MKKLGCSLITASFLVHSSIASAQFPGLDSFKRLLEVLPIPTQAPSSPASAADTGGATMGICALVGIAGAAIGQKLAVSESNRLKLNPQQRRQREQSYMLGFGLFGCTLGTGVAANIIKNMSESARKAQDVAWQQAQQQTGPVAWTDPNNPATRGTTEIVEREKMPDGGECGTRRDSIEAAEGRADPMARICRTAGATVWNPVLV